MTDDAFQDKVQEEFSNIYRQNRSGGPAWTFFSHADDKTGVNATAKKDTESTALYLQGETPKAKDLLMDLKMVPKRKLMPRLLLKRFMTPLAMVVSCQILSSQNMLKFR